MTDIQQLDFLLEAHLPDLQVVHLDSAVRHHSLVVEALQALDLGRRCNEQS